MKCGRCGREIIGEPAIAVYDDHEEKICSECIMATLGPTNEEW